MGHTVQDLSDCTGHLTYRSDRRLTDPEPQQKGLPKVCYEGSDWSLQEEIKKGQIWLDERTPCSFFLAIVSRVG